jgi:hypothetical protein
LKASPQLAPWRPAAGITPKLGDAELITLAVMAALLGYVSEARWLRYARAELPGRMGGIRLLRLHLVATPSGLPVAFALTGASTTTGTPSNKSWPGAQCQDPL